MKKILLTGAAGFIGSNTATALLSRGDVVVGVDNLNDYYDPQLKRDRLENLKSFGVPVVVAINHFVTDTDAEIQADAPEAPRDLADHGLQALDIAQDLLLRLDDRLLDLFRGGTEISDGDRNHVFVVEGIRHAVAWTDKHDFRRQRAEFRVRIVGIPHNV